MRLSDMLKRKRVSSSNSSRKSSGSSRDHQGRGHHQGWRQGRHVRGYPLEHAQDQPFSYGLVISKVYDSGSVFDPEILDITDADLLAKFASGVANVAAMSLAINYPNVASVPHSIVNGMKNLLAIAAATEITFKEAETVKAFLADPSAFAAAAPAAAAAAAP